MKILLAVHGYPPENVGGTELYVSRLAQGLIAREHPAAAFRGVARLRGDGKSMNETTKDTLSAVGCVVTFAIGFAVFSICAFIGMMLGGDPGALLGGVVGAFAFVLIWNVLSPLLMGRDE